jgi:hypothetical protein
VWQPFVFQLEAVKRKALLIEGVYAHGACRAGGDTVPALQRAIAGHNGLVVVHADRLARAYLHAQLASDTLFLINNGSNASVNHGASENVQITKAGLKP